MDPLNAALLKYQQKGDKTQQKIADEMREIGTNMQIHGADKITAVSVGRYLRGSTITRRFRPIVRALVGELLQVAEVEPVLITQEEDDAYRMRRRPEAHAADMAELAAFYRTARGYTPSGADVAAEDVVAWRGKHPGMIRNTPWLQNFLNTWMQARALTLERIEDQLKYDKLEVYADLLAGRRVQDWWRPQRLYFFLQAIGIRNVDHVPDSVLDPLERALLLSVVPAEVQTRRAPMYTLNRAAGFTSLADLQAGTPDMWDLDAPTDRHHYITFRINDDVMEPEVFDGDFLRCCVDEAPQPGAVVVLRYRDPEQDHSPKVLVASYVDLVGGAGYLLDFHKAGTKPFVLPADAVDWILPMSTRITARSFHGAPVGES